MKNLRVEKKRNNLKSPLTLALLSLIVLVTSVFLLFVDAYGAAMFASVPVKRYKAQRYDEMAHDAQKGRLVFFGDSITEMYPLDDYFADTPHYNRGIGGDRTYEMLERLDGNLLALEPSAIVFLGGANDLADEGVSVQGIARNVEEIITRIQDALPDASIVVQSVYPVNSDCSFMGVISPTGTRSNAAIVELNRYIEEICGEKGVIFADVHSLLVSEDGKLAPKYSLDGLHVNDAAYTLVSAKLKELLKLQF